MRSKIFFTLLYFYCNIMKAHLANDVWIKSYSLKYANEGHVIPIPIPIECTNIVNAFAKYASNFTKCSIMNARPITLCAQCIIQYEDFQDKFKELVTTVVNGTSCKSLFISHDRLDVIIEYRDSIVAIWDKGHCDECFDWSQGKPQLSNDTKKFNKLSNETMKCINENYNTTDVCQKCMVNYVQLNEFYQSFSADAIGVDSVCMDIVDSMNITRSIWSKNLNCCNLRRSPEIIFLCCTGVIAMLPILYYLAVGFCGPIRDLPNVLKQSRFKQMILRSQGGRIN